MFKACYGGNGKIMGLNVIHWGDVRGHGRVNPLLPCVALKTQEGVLSILNSCYNKLSKS